MNIQDTITQSVAEAVKKVIENEKDFKPHMMYDPKTGKEYEAKTYEDHLKMADMGYVHEKPKDKEEGNAFGQAVTSAKKAGKKKFKFQGKDYKVEGAHEDEDEEEVEEGVFSKVRDKLNPKKAKARDMLVKLAKQKAKIEAKKQGFSDKAKRAAAQIKKIDDNAGDYEDPDAEMEAAEDRATEFRFEAEELQKEIDKISKNMSVISKKFGVRAPKNESVEISEDVDNFFGFTTKDGLVKFQSMAKKLKIKPISNPTVMKRGGKEFHVMGFEGSVRDIEKAMKVAAGMQESVELQEAANFGDIEKVMKWAKKNLSGAKLDISKKYGTAFINLTIFNIIILRLGGKKGIVVTHDDRTNGKGKDYEEYFSSANDVIKFVQKIYDEMPKDESANLEEAVKPADFVKGGDTKITKREVDGMLSKIFINTKLAKSVEASEAFKAGEKDAGKKKNPYKSDTADFHLYVLGTQSASM